MKISEALLTIAAKNDGSFTDKDLETWLDSLVSAGYFNKVETAETVTYHITDKGIEKQKRALFW